MLDGINKLCTPAHRHYRLIHDIYVLLDAGDRNVLHQYDLTSSQYRVLILLDPLRGERLMTLSDWMLCARSTVTRLIDQMEAANLVCRVVDPEDRRAQRVALTAQGVALRDKVHQAHENSLLARFGNLTEAEQELLISLLEKVRSNLQLTLGDSEEVLDRE